MRRHAPVWLALLIFLALLGSAAWDEAARRGDREDALTRVEANRNAAEVARGEAVAARTEAEALTRVLARLVGFVACSPRVGDDTRAVFFEALAELRRARPDLIEPCPTVPRRQTTTKGGP